MKNYLKQKQGFAVLVLILGFISVISSTSAQTTSQTYINDLPQPVEVKNSVKDVQQQLESHVQTMIDLGHLAPTMYFIGIGANPIMFYVTSSETVYALSAAYPYLSPELQQKVKTYLDNEISSYPPLSKDKHYYGPSSGVVSDQQGARREYYQQNSKQTFNFFGIPDKLKNASILYSLWLFSYNTDDWRYVTDNYASAKQLYQNAKANNVIDSYPELAGVIGFARIAQHLNKTDDYNDAMSFAEKGFAAGQDFNKFLSTARKRYPNQISAGHGYTTPIFLYNRKPLVAAHFNRDIGRFLKDKAKSPASEYVAELSRNLKVWWLTDVAMAYGENAYATPEISWTNFMLHAYVLDTPVEKLKSYLDAPNRRGDLFYIQKLVAVIEQGANSGDTPTATPTPTRNTSQPTATATSEGNVIYLPGIGKAGTLGTPPATPIPTQTTTPSPTSKPTVAPTNPPLPTLLTRRLNIPRFTNGVHKNVPKTAIMWFGTVDNTNNHVQVRAGYNNDEMSFRVTAFDRYIWYDTASNSNEDLTKWDAVTILLDQSNENSSSPRESSYRLIAQMGNGGTNPDKSQAAFKWVNNSWQSTPMAFKSTVSWQGGGINTDTPSEREDRGWRMNFYIPFKSLGLSGPPADGTIWKFAVIIHDRDNQAGTPAIPAKSWPEGLVMEKLSSWGELGFNPAPYQKPTADNLQTITIRQGVNGVTGVRDADVGGQASCGDNDQAGGWRTDWNKWGNANYSGATGINIQNQDNVADWPCFSKPYFMFPLDSVPANKTIVSANLSLYHQGGSTLDDPNNPAPNSWVQVFTIDETWNEQTLTWNNAPLAKQNLLHSSIFVEPIRFPGSWDSLPAKTWDVTQAAIEAYQKNKPMNIALYSADEKLHSGKTFVSSDTPDWNVRNRPILEITFGDSTATPVATNTPNATPISTATSTPPPLTFTLTAEPTSTVATPTPTSIIPVITTTATPTNGDQIDPGDVGETDPNKPDLPWYANGRVVISPNPVVTGLTTTVTITVENPTTSTQTVSMTFRASGLGVGQWWTTIGEFTNIEIPANGTITKSATWFPPLDGHVCVVVFVEDMKTGARRHFQQNIDSATPASDGCYTQSFQVCNAFDTLETFDLNVTKKSGPEGGNAIINTPRLSIAPGACTDAQVSICLPKVATCGQKAEYLVEPDPGNDGILFELDVPCSTPTPTPTPTSTPTPTPTVSTSVAAPYFGSGPVTPSQMALTQFKQADGDNDQTDIRVGYTDQALHVQLNTTDRQLQYNPILSSTDIADWDGATIYLSRDDGSNLTQNSYRFEVQISNDNTNRSSYEATAKGNSGTWSAVPLVPPISTISTVNGSLNNNGDTDSNWQLEITIPFKSLGGPPTSSVLQPVSDVWRLGVTINDRDTSGLKTTSWPSSPLNATAPNQWGTLHFKPTSSTIQP